MMLFQESVRVSLPEPPELFARNCPPLREGIRRARSITIYEGLPHPRWEHDQALAEKKRKKTRVLHDFDFYAEPVVFGAHDREQLRQLCQAQDLYQPYGGPKRCGGYHPDWGISFDDIQVFFCFGCNEARLYGPQQSVFADLNATTGLRSLKALLNAHHHHRPKTIRTAPVNLRQILDTNRNNRPAPKKVP